LMRMRTSAMGSISQPPLGRVNRDSHSELTPIISRRVEGSTD